MNKLEKFGSLLTRFRTDSKGTIAAIWAFSAMAVVIAVGSAYDYSQISAARQKSQSVADMIALTAAVYIRDNDGEKPTNSNDGFVDKKRYNLKDLDLYIDPYVNQQTIKRGKRKLNEPFLKVFYDSPQAGQVTVKVVGKTAPAFMQIAGVDKVDFSSQSTVSYEVKKTEPASIFLVLDNSGSMSITDDDNISRMNELQASVRGFMDALENIVSSNTDTHGDDAPRVLRTAQIPYYNRVDYNLDVPPKWGVLTDWEINRMYAGGSTNSGPAMTLAKQWMSYEQAIHTEESGADSMLPYVIFMTDGVNNRSSYDTVTLAQCEAMKESGVKIFTVGYALSNSGIVNGSSEYRALNMLKTCASGAGNFFHAESASALTKIFEDIGQDIVQDTIRIRS